MSTKILRSLKKSLGRFLALGSVIFRAIQLDECHIIKFYWQKRVRDGSSGRNVPVRFRVLSKELDLLAKNSLGDAHDRYSGASSPEVLLAFDTALASLAQHEVRYLEIGSAKGKSLAAFFLLSSNRNLSFSAVSVDPYLADSYVEGQGQPERFLRKQSGWVAPICADDRQDALLFWKKMKINAVQLQDYSKNALSVLEKEGASFNLIYIDGNHDGIHPLQDFVGVLEVIEDEGVLILDDIHWHSVHHLKRIIEFSPEFEKVMENWKVAVFKLRQQVS